MRNLPSYNCDGMSRFFISFTYLSSLIHWRRYVSVANMSVEGDANGTDAGMNVLIARIIQAKYSVM